MFIRVFLSCVLAIATVFGPYASASRAEAAVPAVLPYAVGTAFATVASLYGYSVASGDTDFEALGSSVMDAIDNVSVDDFNKGLASFGTFNPVTSVVAAQTYTKEWLSSAGQVGSINLDDLTALGDITTAYLPVILSQLLSASGSSGEVVYPDVSFSDSVSVPVGNYTGISSVYPVYLYSMLNGSGTRVYYCFASDFLETRPFKVTVGSLYITFKFTGSITYAYEVNGVSKTATNSSGTFNVPVTGGEISPDLAKAFDDSWSPSVPGSDVINGKFDDAGAISNPDVLNPGRSQALGSDAVFDGDTLVSHGNIGILNPSDYADIDSWADALAKLRAGILEDINAAVAAGAITLESAITAALDGALVTDKVSNLNGKDTGSSISRPRNWKNLGKKFTQLFPFCLYYDMAKCVAFLEAEPVAPKFDWVIPSMFKDKNGNPITYKIHFDMTPWDSAAGFLRMILTFAFAFGFVFLILKFVNPRRSAGGGD